MKLFTEHFNLIYVDGFRQSEVKTGDVEYLPIAYTRAVVSSLIFLTDVPKSILLIGLGGATFPSYLKKHFSHSKIEVVELFQGMVTVAEKYGNFKQDENCIVIIDDAADFINKNHNKKQYDLIIQDGCSIAPCPLLILDTFKKLSSMLTPNGIYIQNQIGMDPPVIKNIKDSFKDFYYVESKSINQVIVAHNSDRIYTKENLILRAQMYQAAENPTFNVVEEYARNYKRLTDIMINSENYLEYK
ncbi:hypothetical protein PPL_06474 [Heterostelium album PN500]|uniref:Spermidine synthase n=1 Tax=Heterostelium pallidum (strain ATCC 26659 / Pp 5 / PN500) TaxID=670386 RepID=D3BD93_HETP5|nr:hypothetical protein PPL_06474 [Heterostelium album PN500]EFA80885.1 hypothetical protein PPL_06474 [Heterostelium album PN500]|eukprot:XP_020433004.1 hypothetical protein PPL_06474 [Heterostelium album PN500]